jgi:hypothetical protein
MKRRSQLILIILYLETALVMSQTDSLHSYFGNGTALTLPKNKTELRFYGYSGYGLTNRVELEIHPLLCWIFPQAGIKVRVVDRKKIIIATEHQLEYPTLLLRFLSRKGIGGLISPEFNFPQMLSVYNGVLVSCRLKADMLLTAKAGINFSLKSGTIDNRSSIDLPILFSRFAVYYHSPVITPSIDLRAKIISSFGSQISFTSFITPGTPNNLFIENRGFLSWTKSRFRLKAGYLLCYGEYPYGHDWHLLPAIEVLTHF